MIKLIIFDWDDVFTLGSKEGYFKCYHRALESVSINLEPKEEKKRILENWGKSHEDELKGLLKERPELIDGAVKAYEDNLFGNTFIDCLSIVSGTQDFLRRLNKKYTLALATGVHPKMLKEKIIPKFNIPNVFSQIITAYDIKDPNKRKPHPFVVREIIKNQNVLSEETIFVGDAENDVKLARNAGIIPVVVLTGHLTKKEAEALKVSHIIKNIISLEEVLNNL